MIGTLTSRMALAAASSAFLFAACASVAAEPAKPATAAETTWKGKNLQIFPADTPRDQLLGAMKSFSSSLGVECSFCHASGADGKLDPASDAKKEKASARWMLAMVKRLNQNEFKVTGGAKAKVTCYTCHRGSPRPATAPQPTDATAKPAERGH